MKLQTKIPVKYNSGIASQEENIVEGTLRMCMQELHSENNYFNFNYSYQSIDGVSLNTGNFTLSKNEINDMYNYLKTELPVDLLYTDTVLYLYYLGMRMKMAETFGVTINDIEIILD